MPFNPNAIPAPPPFNILIAEHMNKIEEVLKETGLIKTAPPFKSFPPRPVPEKKIFNDSINVSTKKLDTNYAPLALKGFSENRPEILCVTDFEPAYRKSASTKQLNNNRSLLPAGEKLKLVLQLARLRNHNIEQLISVLRQDKESAKIIDGIEREYDVKIKSAIDDIRAVTSLMIALEKSKDALNIRKSQSKVIQKVGVRLNFMSQPIGYTDILESFGFERENISNFSNTKILMQLINDYSTMLTNYSPGLLGIINDNRGLDDDSFEIVGNLFDPIKEPKVLDELRSQGAAGLNYFEIVEDFFSNMRNEPVFSSAENRIKFLSNFISKEFVLSAGLGNNNTASLLSIFGTSPDGNIFDDILGAPGGDVFEPPRVSNGKSLAGFMSMIDSQSNRVVLPFESPLTEDDEDKFIAGSEVYVDPIVQGQAKMDPTPLVKFTGDLNSASDPMRTLIERRLLSLKGNNRAPRPTGKTVFDDVVEIFNDMYNPAKQEKKAVSDKRFVLLALLRMSSDNLKLKSLLYQYTLLIGASRGAKGNKKSASSMKIYRQAVRSDIQYLEDLPALRDARGGMSSATPGGGGYWAFRGAGENDQFVLKQSPVPPDALSYIVDRIMEEVIAINGFSNLTLSVQVQKGRTINLTLGVVKDALIETGGPASIFQNINMFTNELADRARRGFSGPTNSPSSYHIDNTSYRTRFSYLSPAVLVGVTFELFASVSTLTDAIIESLSGGSAPGVNISSSPSGQKAFGNAVVSPGNGSTQTFQSSNISNINTSKPLLNNQVQTQFDEIRSSLSEELNLMSSVTSFIFTYLDIIRMETKPLIDLTRQSRSRKKANSNSVLKRIEKLQERVDSDDIFATLNPAQIALSIRQAVEIQRSMRFATGKNISAFSDPTFLAPAAEEMLFALLREPKFKQGRASNMKIVTVGLPTGFKSSLRSVELEDESLPGPERESDVIAINVYRRDLEFEDIVFKPMQFTFELSRFTQVSPKTKSSKGKRLLGTSNSIAADEKVKTFNIQVDEDFRWTSGGTAGGLNKRSETINNVAQSPGYDWLSPSDKIEMFQNHVTSYFLNTYLRLLTDIDFSESTFLVNNTVSQEKADAKDRDRFVKLMLKKVKNIAGRTITLDDLKKTDPRMSKLLDKLENQDATQGINGKIESAFKDLSVEANVEITENIVNFMNSFSPDSFLTGADVTATRLTSPKLFERIFHMAVDLDNFEVDVKQTRATAAGRKMLKSGEFKAISRTVGRGRIFMKPRPTDQGSHILSEIFVNAESKLVQESKSRRQVSPAPSKELLEVSKAGINAMPKISFNKGFK